MPPRSESICLFVEFMYFWFLSFFPSGLFPEDREKEMARPAVRPVKVAEASPAEGEAAEATEENVSAKAVVEGLGVFFLRGKGMGKAGRNFEENLRNDRNGSWFMLLVLFVLFKC